MKKKERKRLIRQISQASGVAQYALDAKMTDEQVSEAAQNLNALGLIKSANTYNRHCQGKKTEAANDKLREFIKSQWEESTTYNLGKRIWNALTKTGEERKQDLLNDDLVHKEDYNQMASSYRDALDTQREGYSENMEQMIHLKDVYEARLKTLKHQLEKTEAAVEYYHGASGLKKVKTMVRRQMKADQG